MFTLLGTSRWEARGLSWARMLIERNKSIDRDKTRILLTEAIAIYRELGVPTFL